MSLQLLTALPALSNPVVPADNKTLCANMAALNNLATCQLKSVSVLALIRELNHNGGKDYRSNHAGLVQDTKILLGGIPLITGEESRNKVLIQTALDWNAGRAADNTLSTDVATLLAAVNDFIALPEETLNRMLGLLRYRLAV